MVVGVAGALFQHTSSARGYRGRGAGGGAAPYSRNLGLEETLSRPAARIFQDSGFRKSPRLAAEACGEEQDKVRHNLQRTQ